MLPHNAMRAHTPRFWSRVRRLALPCVAVSALAASLACGGARERPATHAPQQDPMSVPTPAGPSACEGHVLLDQTPREDPAPPDPLRCAELTPMPLVPQPTPAMCRALPSAERAPCLARLRARSRVVAPLDAARSAATRHDWVAALNGFEAALERLPGEPDLLAELGWARFHAATWCRQTQDVGLLQDQLEAPTGPDPVTVLCTRRVAIPRAQQELAAAVSAAPTVAQRALWQQWSAQVALGVGEEAEAFEAARRSLCALEDTAARQLVGDLLSRAGHRAGPDAPEEAITLYGQSMLVHPTPEKQDYVANISAEHGAGFSISAPPSPPEPPHFYPDIPSLCAALVGRQLTEPASPEEVSHAPCETSDWEDVGIGRGERLDVPFTVAVMRAESPERYHGMSAAKYLVARSPRGLNVLLMLGREHGDDRQYHMSVGSIVTTPHRHSPDAPLSVSWEVGEAHADGCGWDTAATRHVTLCALVDGVPRCFAWANLGRAEFASDSLPPTADQALGRCDSVVQRPRERRYATFRPRYDLTLTEQELVATRVRDGAMLCLPLRETLAPLREPADRHL